MGTGCTLCIEDGSTRRRYERAQSQERLQDVLDGSNEGVRYGSKHEYRPTSACLLNE